MPHTPRRYLRLAKLAIAAALLLWFARFAYLRITLKPTPRPEYWAAKIAALDPPPPGALSLKETYALLANRPWEAAATSAPAGAFKYGFDYTAMLEGEWDAARPDIVVLAAMFQSPGFVAARSAMLDVLRRGLTFADAQTPDPQPNLHSNSRAWAKCLVAHARWARMNGDLNSATDDLLATLRLAREGNRPRIAITALIAASEDALVAQELILASRESHGLLSPSAFEPELKSRAVGDAQTPMFSGERLYNYHQLECFYVRDGGDWIDLSQAVAHNRGIWGGASVTPTRLWNLLSPLYHDLPRARQAIDAAIDQAESFQTTGSARAACDISDNQRPNLPGPLDGERLGQWSAFPRATMLILKSREFLDAAMTIAAIEQFHANAGKYPNRITDLTPEYLSRLPLDYGDLRPLRYKRTATGYLLYGVGIDGRDDGGKFNLNENITSETQPDIVYSALRRRKSPE